MIFTPLKIGDILQISDSARELTRDTFCKNGVVVKPSLLVGHNLQFSHDEVYGERGVDMTLQSHTAENYDRTMYNDRFLLDDKVCTFLDKDGKIQTTRSRSHTISHTEMLRWNRHLEEVPGGDVVLLSFDYIDASHSAAVFKGCLSWRLASPFIKEMESRTYTLAVSSARRYNLIA